ncbi:MAG TPA: DUF2087 domain-containing protein [Dehalococcoidia bacterium]|nr:DUF2087 domain-containing protein [Dehalococcoidia bacterium]
MSPTLCARSRTAWRAATRSARARSSRTDRCSDGRRARLTILQANGNRDGRLERYLDRSGRLRQFPAKRRGRETVLCWLAANFEVGARYSEAEVNEILGRPHSYDDPAMLRRALCDHGYLGREADGSAYWRA